MAEIKTVDVAKYKKQMVESFESTYVGKPYLEPYLERDLIFDGYKCRRTQEKFMEFKRGYEAAVLSANAGKVPDGYVLVPVYPTEKMIQAACKQQSLEKFDTYHDWWNSHSGGISERIRNYLVDDYKAMIEAALQSQQSQEVDK